MSSRLYATKRASPALSSHLQWLKIEHPMEAAQVPSHKCAGPTCTRSAINTDKTFRKAPKIDTMCVIFKFVGEIPIEGGHPRIISIPAPEKAHVKADITASSFFTAVRLSGGVHASASASAVVRS